MAQHHEFVAMNKENSQIAIQKCSTVHYGFLESVWKCTTAPIPNRILHDLDESSTIAMVDHFRELSAIISWSDEREFRNINQDSLWLIIDYVKTLNDQINKWQFSARAIKYGANCRKEEAFSKVLTTVEDHILKCNHQDSLQNNIKRKTQHPKISKTCIKQMVLFSNDHIYDESECRLKLPSRQGT
ncbi:hypothetical protein RF11_12530 [Thelohanellus kitauei]|uniref:Uncharacterized protein n=1 Tax=Thelohanellus kitauei TaxID=669202 RepID=A0A0C2MAD2_THEKT|nr:hypothetical protein RF11_12530 [Thelohanellus kitauei]